MQDAFIMQPLRTPFGRYAGKHSSTRPDDLLAGLIRTWVDRTGADANAIDEVIIGNANGAGEENRNVARMSSLLAGLPVQTPGVTVNRLCGSSLEAIVQATRAVRTGDASAVLAGGVESMTRAPLVLPKPARAFAAHDITAESTTLGWRLVNPAMPTEWTISLGAANEHLARRWKISRSAQDAFALRSHELAAKAWRDGRYSTSVTAGDGAERDESVREDASIAALAGLRPAFDDDGTITAGNASPLSDGASVVMVGDSSAARSLGVEPSIRIAASATVGNDPRDFGIAPIEAAHRAARRAGISLSDLGAIELNEAFAVQSLICISEWGVRDDLVNAWGGAIAIGHPLGASGGRLVGTLAERMTHGGIRWGMASLCVGVGQGMALILENTAA